MIRIMRHPVRNELNDKRNLLFFVSSLFRIVYCINEIQRHILIKAGATWPWPHQRIMSWPMNDWHLFFFKEITWTENTCLRFDLYDLKPDISMFIYTCLMFVCSVFTKLHNRISVNAFIPVTCVHRNTQYVPSASVVVTAVGVWQLAPGGGSSKRATSAPTHGNRLAGARPTSWSYLSRKRGRKSSTQPPPHPVGIRKGERRWIWELH